MKRFETFEREEEMTNYDRFKLSQNEAKQKLFGGEKKVESSVSSIFSSRNRAYTDTVVNKSEAKRNNAFESGYTREVPKNEYSSGRGLFDFEPARVKESEYTYKDYLLEKLSGKRSEGETLLSEEAFYGGSINQKNSASSDMLFAEDEDVVYYRGKKSARENADYASESNLFRSKKSSKTSNKNLTAHVEYENTDALRAVSSKNGTLGDRILSKVFGNKEFNKGGKIFIAVYVIIVLVVALVLIVSTTSMSSPANTVNKGASADTTGGSVSSSQETVQAMTLEDEECGDNWFDRLCDSLNK